MSNKTEEKEETKKLEAWFKQSAEAVRPEYQWAKQWEKIINRGKEQDHD